MLSYHGLAMVGGGILHFKTRNSFIGEYRISRFSTNTLDASFVFCEIFVNHCCIVDSLLFV